MNSLDQASDRLSYAIAEERDRKIVFLTGSGISLPHVPSTQDMIEVFLDEMGQSSQAVRRMLESYSGSEKYERAAQELKQRRGDRGLASAIRKGVLRALASATRERVQETGSYEDTDWNLPAAQTQLARLVSLIPRQQQGPILTTNFDSLTESALRLASVGTVSLAVPGNNAIPIDSIFGVLPVIHLHGIWSNTATLSTATQLTSERPQVEAMISRILDKAILVVTGYGGWDDSFTRALVKLIKEGRTALLDTEIMWLAYEDERSLSDHILIKEIRGFAGVNVYYGIDSAQFLTSTSEKLGLVKVTSSRSDLGWETPALVEASEVDTLNFVRGTQPTWSTANAAPRLHQTQLTIDRVKSCFEHHESDFLVLAGPTGEGKSTTLLQVGLELADEDPSIYIASKKAAAPRITAEWVESLTRESSRVLLLVDEADLVLDQILLARQTAKIPTGCKIVWLISVHSSHLHHDPLSRITKDFRVDVISTGNIDVQDARQISEHWKTHGLTPPGLAADVSADDLAQHILTASGSMTGNSLFGATLKMWNSEELVDRVHDLSVRLARHTISGISLQHILNCVAVTQTAWSESSKNQVGLSMSAVAFLTSTRSEDVLRIVIEPLGREVGISRLGNSIFVRHASMASAIVNHLRASGQVNDVCRDLGRIASEMKYSKQWSRQDYATVHGLPRHLRGEEAVQAAIGQVEGAPQHLGPRVTAMTALRESNRVEDAERYANAITADIRNYTDYRSSYRGYLVELSVINRKLGHLEKATVDAVRAVSDQVDGMLREDTLRYALVNLSAYLRSLALIGRPGAHDFHSLISKILGKMPLLEPKFGRLADHNDRSSIGSLIGSFTELSRGFTPEHLTFSKMSRVIGAGLGQRR